MTRAHNSPEAVREHKQSASWSPPPKQNNQKLQRITKPLEISLDVIGSTVQTNSNQITPKEINFSLNQDLVETNILDRPLLNRNSNQNKTTLGHILSTITTPQHVKQQNMQFGDPAVKKYDEFQTHSQLKKLKQHPPRKLQPIYNNYHSTLKESDSTRDMTFEENTGTFSTKSIDNKKVEGQLMSPKKLAGL